MQTAAAVIGRLGLVAVDRHGRICPLLPSPDPSRQPTIFPQLEHPLRPLRSSGIYRA